MSACMAQLAHGDEPRQVHRLPHLLGHLQAGVDQPVRRRVRVVQQRRDPARARATRAATQDQERWQGGWTLNRRGRLTLQGRRPGAQAAVASSPTRCCRTSTTTTSPGPTTTRSSPSAPLGDDFPVAQPKSLLTGEPTTDRVERQLGRRPRRRARARRTATRSCSGSADAGRGQGAGSTTSRRSCSSCRGSASTASTRPAWRPARPGRCTSAARTASCSSTRTSCRGWRMCVTGCPYKKVYFNHRTGKAEKCTFCYPRVEVGLPTVCSRDLRRAAALHRAGPLRRRPGHRRGRHRGRAATSTRPSSTCCSTRTTRRSSPRRAGRASPTTGSRPPSRSPVYALAKQYRVALPLHPEFRTMPMVWYVPPLSPVVEALRDTGHDGEDVDNLFGAIDTLRIPVEYLAELFTAGDTAPVTAVLQRLAAMRSYMRRVTLDEAAGRVDRRRGRDDRRRRSPRCTGCWRSPSTTSATSSRPPTPSTGHALEETGLQPRLRRRAGDARAAGRSARRPAARCRCRSRPSTRCGQRQTGDEVADPGSRAARVNLLNWDGKGAPPRLFPPAGRPHRRARGEPRRSGARPTPSCCRPPRCCCSTRTRGARAAAGRCGARSPSCPPGRPRERLLGFLDAAGGDAARRAGRQHYVDVLDQHAPLLPLPDLVDRRRDPPPRARARPAQGALPRPPASSSSPAELPDFLPVVLEFAAAADADGRPRAAAGAPAPGSSCCGWPWSSAGTPYAGAGRGRLRAAAGAVAARTRPRPRRSPAAARRASRSGWPATASRAARPRLRPRPEARAMSRSTCCCGACCRTSWSPSWSAARSGASATTSSAGPPARRSSTSRGCCGIGSPLFHFGILVVLVGHVIGLLIPKSLDRRGRAEPGGLPRPGRSCSAASPGSARSSASAILIYRRRTTGPVFMATTRNDKIDVRRARRRHRGRARHHAARRRRAARTHNYRQSRSRRGSGRCSCSSRTSTAMAARRTRRSRCTC